MALDFLPLSGSFFMCCDTLELGCTHPWRTFAYTRPAHDSLRQIHPLESVRYMYGGSQGAHEGKYENRFNSSHFLGKVGINEPKGTRRPYHFAASSFLTHFTEIVQCSLTSRAVSAAKLD